MAKSGKGAAQGAAGAAQTAVVKFGKGAAQGAVGAVQTAVAKSSNPKLGSMSSNLWAPAVPCNGSLWFPGWQP